MNASFRQSSWLVTLSLAAIAVVYMTWGWLPGRKAVQKIRDDIETKQATIAQSTGLSSALMDVQREIEKTQSVVDRWDRSAPKQKDLSALFGRINTLAKSAKLTIRRFDPQPPVVYETLREIPIAMSCSGTFAQVYEFLRSVEQLEATIWVESIRMESIAKDRKDAKDVQCELNLVVFSNNSKESDYANHTN